MSHTNFALKIYTNRVVIVKKFVLTKLNIWAYKQSGIGSVHARLKWAWAGPACPLGHVWVVGRHGHGTISSRLVRA
jgi:hypothetical protein